MKIKRINKIILSVYIAIILCGIAIIISNKNYSYENSYAESTFQSTNEIFNVADKEIDILIYRNGTESYYKKITSSATYDTDIYFKLGDTLRIVSSSGVSNFDLDTDIIITEDKFPKNSYQIVITNDTGITACLDFHIVRVMPQIIIDGNYFDYNTTLFYNSDKEISWACDNTISNPQFSGISIKSSGNKAVDEYIKFSSTTHYYNLTTDVDSETIYTLNLCDAAENQVEIIIVIDKQAPLCKIISNGKELANNRATNKPVYLQIDEENVTVQYTYNGSSYMPYQLGQVFDLDGIYTVLLTDRVGNTKIYTVTINTAPPEGQLYANYEPIQNGGITNSNIYFTWDDNAVRVTVNGKPYRKNSVISADGDYTFVMTDPAGNKSTYSITKDTKGPSFNIEKLSHDKSYKISKCYIVTIEKDKYSFASYDEAIEFAINKEFKKNVISLTLNNVEEFSQTHLVASNGDPNNSDDEIRTGEYWLYKSQSNPNSLLYYFDRNLLQNVIRYYVKNSISNVNYYCLTGNNDYGIPSESMYDNIWHSNGSLYPIGNNFSFTKSDSSQVYAQLVDDENSRKEIEFNIPLGKQITVSGLYKIIEIDEAKNETIYYLYLDFDAPELLVHANFCGRADTVELTISNNVNTGFYFEKLNLLSIIDADKWSVLSVTHENVTSRYTFGDDLPLLYITGEYTIELYDRLDNYYKCTVFIAGNPANITFENKSDDTAFDINILLEQDFDTIVSLVIRRNGIVLDYVNTSTLHYTFDKTGTYTITLQDSFGRTIERNYNFVKPLPLGNLSGVNNGGKTKTDVTFTYEATKYYAVVFKDGTEAMTNRNGYIHIVASEENSSSYIIKLINLADTENYNEYSFKIKTFAPEIILHGVDNNGVTKGDVTVSWVDDDIVTVYYVRGNDKQLLINGQIINADGTYVITAINDLGIATIKTFIIDRSIDYDLMVRGKIVENIETTNQAFAIIGNEPLSITITKDGIAIEFSIGDYITEEGIYAINIEDEYGNSKNMVITIDTTAPQIKLQGVQNGGIVDGKVTITEASEIASIEVYKNGKLIDYELGQEISEYANYRIVVTDKAGNVTEYAFILKHLLNGGSVALIIIGVLFTIGIFISVFILRKKGKFKLLKK